MAIQTDKPQNVDSSQSKVGQQLGKQASKVTDKVAKKAAKEQKDFLKKLANKLGKKGIEEGIKTAVMSFIKTIIVPLAIILLILVTLFSVTTLLRTFFLGKSDIEVSETDVELKLEVDSITESVQDAVVEAFDNIKKKDETADTIADYIEEKCGYDVKTGGLFGWFKNDVQEGENGYDIQTDRYDIQVVFEPSIDVIAKNVAAYVTAVDSTIMFYADTDDLNDEKLDKHFTVNEDGNIDVVDGYTPPSDKNMYKTDASGNLVLNDDIIADIDGSQPDDIKESSPEFVEKIREDSDKFFTIEDNTEAWEDLGKVNLYKAKIPHTESHTACVLSYSGGEKEADQSMCDRGIGGSSYGYIERTYTETVYLDGYKGTITVPIYFDVTSYREDELNALADKITGKGKCIFEEPDETEQLYSNTCTEEEAHAAINTILFNYVNSNMVVYGVDETYYGLLWGGVKGFDGVVEYTGELDWPSLTGKHQRGSTKAEIIWGKALNYHKAGKIGGSTTNPNAGCTYFAQLWFYEVYGMNSSGPGLGPSGNGDQFAEVVLENYPDKFEKGREPAPGGLLSIKYTSGKWSGYGHIVCIDEVEYTNAAHTEGWVTFSDGNYDGAGGVRIRERMSLKDFKNNWNGQYKYVNPKHKI